MDQQTLASPHPRSFIRPFAAGFLVLCTTSCATMFGDSGEEQRPVRVNSSLVVDIFAARGFLGGADYEQYKLSGGELWRECGHVPQPSTVKTGATGPTKAGLSPVERRIDSPTRPELSELLNAAEAVLTESATKRERLPTPGGISSLVDPGVVELRISLDGKQRTFITSVDAMSDGGSPVAKSLRALFERVRGVGPVICKAPTFFGVRR